MSKIFLGILNMSIAASWTLFAIIVVRLFIKRAPKWITVALWGILGIRLVCPFSVESVLSLIPSAQTVSPDIMTDKIPQIHSGISALNSYVNPIITESFTPDVTASANPLQILVPILAAIWITGIALMLLYTFISYINLKRKVSTAILIKDNVFESERVATPFVLGIIKPKIYLPINMSEQDANQVIAHEKAHILRKDHLFKPLGFLVLSLHWFNPLIWLGYILLCKDIELACDEKVIKTLGNEQKAEYSEALLSCSINRKSICACPIAFGEVGVKARIKSVLHYKKPALWVIVVAAVLTVIVALCFLTNPKTTLDGELAVFVDMQVAEHHYSKGHTDGNFIVTDYDILDVVKTPSKTTVYMWVMYQEYSLENGKIKKEAGAHTLSAISAKRTGKHGHYELIEYWTPKDGSYYKDSIVKKIPWYLLPKALDSQRNVATQQANCDNAAKEYFADDMLHYTWTYNPTLSFTGHSFNGFLFDLDYTHIVANCTYGMMHSLDANGQPSGKTLTFNKGETVYWSPEDAVIENIPDTTDVTFMVYNGDTQTAGATIQFECVSKAVASAEFKILIKELRSLDIKKGDRLCFSQKSLEFHDKTPTEDIEQTLKNGEFVTRKAYYENQDGLWICDGHYYKYRLEITGRMHNAAKDSSFVVLANSEDITFDMVWKASGLSSNTADYFRPDFAVIVAYK